MLELLGERPEGPQPAWCKNLTGSRIHPLGMKFLLQYKDKKNPSSKQLFLKVFSRKNFFKKPEKKFCTLKKSSYI